MSNIEILSLPLSDKEIPRLKLDKKKLLDTIEQLLSASSLDRIRSYLKDMIDEISLTEHHPWAFNGSSSKENLYQVDQEIFLDNLQQIRDSKTLQRATYYLNRLKSSITRVKTGKINDINLNRWKEYKEIRTDSLWIDKKRDRKGKHMASYWGNFIPQIPRQMMLRYTKGGEYVLDTFAGSGTTLIECRRLGRHGIGIELNPLVAQEAQFLVDSEENPFNVQTKIVVANSVTANYEELISILGIKKVHLVIMHPPYHDIIRFSDFDEDLSNAKDLQDFLDRLEETGKRAYSVLEKGRFLCLVIGDKYSQGEWIPLGFYSMERMMKIGFRLKSIVVKNFEQTKGKRRQQELWRYRALVGGYYVFKHEYLFIFQKG